MHPLVSIVIPTYNEADNIEAIIREIVRNLENRGFENFEIIVVDDDSPDGTWRIVGEISRRDNRVKLIRRTGERGLGTAILRGLREAKGDYIIVMDADFQHPPSLVPELLSIAVRDGYDIIVASRYTRGGGIRNWGLARRIVSSGARALAWLLVPESRRSSDPISGFFLVKKGSLKFNGVKGLGYKVLLEILAHNLEARVADVPYVFEPRRAGSSKLGLKDIILYMIQVFSISSLPRFAMVGAFGILVNLGIMNLALTMGAPVDPASIAGIEASIAWNYTLHELWTFRTTFRGGLGGVLKRYLGYHAAVLLGAVVQYATMRTLYTLLGFNPLMGQLIGIILGSLVNYALSREAIWIHTSPSS